MTGGTKVSRIVAYQWIILLVGFVRETLSFQSSHPCCSASSFRLLDRQEYTTSNHIRPWQAAAQSATALSTSGTNGLDMLDSGFSFVPLLVVIAVGLALAAQGWINQQLKGDQGLGAFLSDGQGYKKSGFRALTDGDRAASSDPLPWLSLPKLDFVEVAGQEETTEDRVVAQMEDLRFEMNKQLELGNVAEATAVRNKLESLMRENGFEFRSDE